MFRVSCSRPAGSDNRGSWLDVDPDGIEKPAGASPEADDAGAVRSRHGERRPRRRSVAVWPIRPAGAAAEGQRGDDNIGDASKTPDRPLHCSDMLTCGQLDLHIYVQESKSYDEIDPAS